MSEEYVEFIEKFLKFLEQNGFEKEMAIDDRGILVKTKGYGVFRDTNGKKHLAATIVECPCCTKEKENG